MGTGEEFGVMSGKDVPSGVGVIIGTGVDVAICVGNGDAVAVGDGDEVTVGDVNGVGEIGGDGVTSSLSRAKSCSHCRVTDFPR